jgi:hypothetical protein
MARQTPQRRSRAFAWALVVPTTPEGLADPEPVQVTRQSLNRLRPRPTGFGSSGSSGSVVAMVSEKTLHYLSRSDWRVFFRKNTLNQLNHLNRGPSDGGFRRFKVATAR